MDEHATAEVNYPLDVENVAEMSRLTRQAKVLTAATSFLPKGMQITTGQAVLDIGCGPGEWVLALAQTYPAASVVGIDISQTMIVYARSLAQEQEISNVQFHVMDATRPLSFPNESFDLIRARAIAGFMTPQSWRQLLAECYRVLKPGGHIISIEGDDPGSSTGPSLTRLLAILMTAMHRAGHCFTSEGDHFGIAAVAPRLLRDAGFVAIEREAFAVDYSIGTEAHVEMVQDWSTFFQIGAPFLSRAAGVSEEEIAVLRARAIAEMQAPDFCAMGFLQQIWGTKPAQNA